MKKTVVLFAMLCLLVPSNLLADEKISSVDERGNNITIYESDMYPDLQFIYYDEERVYAAPKTEEIIYAYIPHEVVVFDEPVTIKGAIFDYNTSIESIEFEDGIEWVRMYKCTNLRDVKLPRTIKDLSMSVWKGDEPTPANEYEGTGDSREYFYGSFMGCSSLESISIPWGLEKIDGAFIDCTNLTSVTFEKEEWDELTPVNFTSMTCTFLGCSSLRYVEIPGGVESLTGTFNDCTSLVDVYLPISLTNIWNTFANCTSLTNTDFLNGRNITEMSYSFGGCTGLLSAFVPRFVTAMDEAFVNCTSLENVTIDSDVLTNMREAFSGCLSLQQVETNENGSIRRVEKSVLIPQSVKLLRKAFYKCKKIENAVFPAECAFYASFNDANSLFSDCSSLKSVVFPTNTNLEGIAERMFENCKSLKDITIPASITKIRDLAFMNCENLESITFNGKVPPYVYSKAFVTGKQDINGQIPTGSLSSYESAFKKCNDYNKANGYGIIKFETYGPEPVLAGDANGDGVVDDKDIPYVGKRIFSVVDIDSLTKADDVNGDGVVDISDITMLVNILLKKGSNEAEYVDLGLPSGTLWATRNVGASSPDESGIYYAWGETEDYTSQQNYGSNMWSHYKWCDGSMTTLNKYNTDANFGTTDGKTVLDLEDDAAYVNLGSEWCIPTAEQFRELVNKEYTTVEWTRNDWAFGYKITSKTNGKFIFLPVCGYYMQDILFQEGAYGYYWTSSLATYAPKAQFLELASNLCNVCLANGNAWNAIFRCYGCNIRPVRRAAE